MNKKSCVAIFSLSASFLFAGCGNEADSTSLGSAGTPPPTSEAIAPPPPETPDGAVRHVAESLLQHEPEGVWAALPESYQADVDGLIKEFSGTMDADVYDRAFVLAERFGRVLLEKKDLFLESEMLSKNVDRVKASEHWESLTSFIETLSTSEIARLEGLSTLDMNEFLSGTGGELLAKWEQIALMGGEGMFKQLENLQVELLAGEGDFASLRMMGADVAEELEMMRVEGRWVPRDMAEEWPASMARAHERIDSMSAEEFKALKPQIMGIYGMVEGTLGQMEVAESAEQLDQAFQGAVFSVMGMMMGSAMQGMDLKLEPGAEMDMEMDFDIDVKALPARP